MVGTKDIRMRMGDGSLKWMTKEEVRADVEAGMADAVDCAQVPALTEDDLSRIVDIMCEKSRIVSVEPGEEVVLSADGGEQKILSDSGSSALGLEMSRTAAVQVTERMNSLDVCEIAYFDASSKAIKPVIGAEMVHCQNALANTVSPLLYMFMPNIGLYYQPTGPFGNPPDLMREFKIDEAIEAGELAKDAMRDDIIYMGEKLMSVGMDGLDFDTSASGGDIDFVGCLEAVEKMRQMFPNALIQLGMSAESVLGIHGMCEYAGKTVAGLYPHEQVKLAETAGVSTFGPVVNTNTSRSTAWNVARAVTMVKECSKVSNIPLQVNMGMGVGGTPMYEVPPADAITRADKCMIEIAHVDGI
ncbi:MAG: [dimethylamine--corrinoid protein] Co-methyltransferase [Candidatus Methanomethylophilus sp.]|nr:[dimethylamine--corrinoid protein] Co-methyltransferase [Methanomethylophilus sp.]